MHAVDPWLRWNVPTGHWSQAVEFVFSANVPGWHDMHEVRPDIDWNVPCMQAVHSTEPVSYVKDPGVHSLHSIVPFSAEAVPGRHG
jgi:hypothetical protein